MTSEFIDSQTVREYLLGLQQRIVQTFERLDGKPFGHDVWEKPADAQLGGGGLTRIIENGNLLERTSSAGRYHRRPAHSAPSWLDDASKRSVCRWCFIRATRTCPPCT